MTAYLGRVVRAVLPTVSASNAGGFWNPVMAQYYQQAGTWPSGSGADPYFPYNTLLLSGDGTNGAQNNTFLDSSTNNFTITRNGNTTQGSFSPYVGPGNWSNYFDGSGDYLTVASIGTITGDFTYECWIYPTSTATLFLPAQFGSETTGRFYAAINTSRTINLEYFGVGTITLSNATVTANTWNHFAITRSGSTMYGFINGALAGSTTSITGTIGNAGSTFIGASSAGTAPITGFISNFRVIAGTALYTAAFTPPTTPLLATTQTRLLTCNNNGFIDQGAGNYTITRNGDTSVSKFSPFTFYQTTPASYSGYFDGSGDYLTAASNAALTLGSGAFTVEAWVYISGSQTQTYGHQVLGTYDAVSNGYALVINRSSGGPLGIVWASGSPTSTKVTYGTYLNANTWYHIAVVRTSTATNGLTIYLNGVAVATGTDSFNDTVLQTLYIGSQGTGNSFLPGSVSNVRITKGQALYTSTFTPSTSPLTTTSQGATASNVSLLTCQSTTFIDNSTNAFTITANGNATPKRANPFTDTVTGPTPYSAAAYGGSAYFDGAGDSLVLPANAAFSFGTGNFTIEAWAYPNSSGSYRRIFSQYTGAGATQVFLRQNNDNTLMFYVISSTTVIATITSSSSLTLNAWNHCAVSRNGSTFTLFLNGAVVGTASSASSMPDTSALNAYISTYDGGNEVWSGYISNLRVVKGTAVYTGPFVPPAAPVTAVTNTQLLLNATNAGIFDSTTINELETVGAAQISTSVVKYGTGSMSFSGGTSYLVTPVIPPTVFFAPNAWTIEGWFYFNSLTGTSGLMGYPDLFEVTATATALLATYRNTPATAKWSSVTAAISLGTAVWKHIAVVLNNGTMTLYVDGVSVGTPATAVGTPAWGGSGVQRFILGADDQYPFASTPDVFLNGYIDDFRFTNGYARYTSNFTPPTAALPTF